MSRAFFNCCIGITVRECGRGGEEAERNGDGLRKSSGGRGWNPGGPALLPRPRRLHDRDLQLRQPPRRPARRRAAVTLQMPAAHPPLVLRLCIGSCKTLLAL